MMNGSAVPRSNTRLRSTMPTATVTGQMMKADSTCSRPGPRPGSDPADDESDQERRGDAGDPADRGSLVVVAATDGDEDNDGDDVGERSEYRAAGHACPAKPPSWPRKNSSGAGWLSGSAWSMSSTRPMTKK